MAPFRHWTQSFVYNQESNFRIQQDQSQSTGEVGEKIFLEVSGLKFPDAQWHQLFLSCTWNNRGQILLHCAVGTEKQKQTWHTEEHELR